MKKRIVASVGVLSFIMVFAFGFFCGVSTMNLSRADELSSSELINFVSDEDMNVLIPMMDDNILNYTLQELPGSYSRQALISTYLCNDPDFETVLRDYLIGE